MIKLLFAISMVMCLYAVSPAQVFKMPKDVFPLESDKTGFHGTVMLRQKDPAGLFMVYPEEKETMDQLKARVAKYVVPMFLHTDDKSVLPAPVTASIPGHKGDLVGTGSSFVYTSDKKQVCLLFYERSIQDKTYTYGYFAYINPESKEGKKSWPDEKGNGIKFFDEFWKTIAP